MLQSAEKHDRKASWCFKWVFIFVFLKLWKSKSVLGDFNDKNQMKRFCDTYGLKSLIKQPTCYKKFEKPTCRDLMLTNVPYSFYSNEC